MYGLNNNKWDWDWLEGDGSGSLFSQIFYGGILALTLVIWGLVNCVTQSATIRWGHSSLELHGTDAILKGGILIAIGLVLHFHHVWTAHEKLYRWGCCLKPLALLAMVILLVVFFYRQILQ